MNRTKYGDSKIRPKWAAGAAGWILLIFFSSTSLAASWCESLYAYISSSFMPAGVEGHNAVLHFVAHKSFHFMLFFILALWLWNAIAAPDRIRLAVVLAGGLIVGTASEYLQRFFPDRDPAIRDVLINFGSAAIGAVVRLRDSQVGPSNSK